MFRPQLTGAGGGKSPKSIGGLKPYDVLAALYVISERADAADMLELLQSALSGRAEVLAGVSRLPNGCGVTVKSLGPTKAGPAAWNAARLELLAAPAPNLRKG